jgi:hypothetical protein
VLSEKRLPFVLGVEIIISLEDSIFSLKEGSRFYLYFLYL